VPQAEALDELLKKKHMRLDAVIELRVNESALLQRVETRVAEMRARGEEVRIDDTPEVLIKRLASYRSQTEPLIHYYSERRKLLTVDGMMTIEHVTREINRILAAIGAMEAKASKKTAAARRIAKGAKMARGNVPKSAAKRARTTGKGAKASRKAGKPASKGPKKPLRKAAASSRARRGEKTGKTAKKVTKKRAKA
jgi:adenylate kinase